MSSWVQTRDNQTQALVMVEVAEPWRVVGGFPWWWASLVAAGMQAITFYPIIANRDKSQPWSLEGFLHEYAGHGDDQATVAGKYGINVWIARYFWRMVWRGFDYHGEADEVAARAIATTMRDWWAAHGQPTQFTLALQREARQ